ncbi:TetR/AcrR family transcriptional regulator [Kineococcus sp. T90]|nr:TetR/AcrR family transcriptional regulator [Kineococcus indalonis]
MLRLAHEHPGLTRAEAARALGTGTGTTADLVEAILDRHVLAVEELRAQQLARTAGSDELRDWVDCLVRPTARHLDDLGSPTWYARLSAQLAADPRRHALVVERALRSEPLRRTVDGLERCLPGVPPAVRAERADMVRLLTVHVFAERETALAEGRAPARASWAQCADGLVDALVGLWLAPVTTR